MASLLHRYPHVAWPLFVVGLLTLSIGTCVVTVIAATSDNGAQVVERYYEEAVHWDSLAAVRDAGAALGWTTDVSVGACAADGCSVEVSVRDRSGAPVSGLSGIVRARRPQTAGIRAERPLAPAPDAPGTYRQRLPVDADGLWDFDVSAARAGTPFAAQVRVTVVGVPR